MSDLGPGGIPDLKRVTLELLNQVPEGKVTTYKDLAEALGDSRAARSVGTIMANNPKPGKYPCWRVVHSDGRVGKYSGGSGREDKISKILDDGIPVEGGKIKNLPRFRFQDYEITPPLKELREMQERIPRAVSRSKGEISVNRAAGVDVSYGEEGVVASYVEIRKRDKEVLRKEVLKKDEVKFPYIPGYLAFRELPILAELLKKLKSNKQLADVIFVDGNGLLHPRKAGLASHLGVVIEHTTIGVAKKLLCGSVNVSGMEAGERRSVRVDGERLGLAVRTYERANPIYVSVGNEIPLETAGNLALEFSQYKLPKPLRRAHKLAKREAT
ncbi:MAG: endonuclease V [Candidatus Acetothermia bacterium]